MEFLESGFKSAALKTITEITKTGFELRVSPSWNAIYFSIIKIPKISYFTILVIQNFVQNTQKTCEFHLYCWDHICSVNEWCLVDCFHCKFKVSTQIMVCNYCIANCKKFCACGSQWRLMALQTILLWFIKFVLITNLQEYG